MNSVLPEIFEKFLKQGIQSQYSEKNQKLHICATNPEDIRRIYEIIKRFDIRLSFVDSPNPQIIFEYRPARPEIRIDSRSMTCEVDTVYNILEAERHLNSEGFSLGYYFPPVLTDPEYLFGDWIADYHIPALNYFQSDLAANLRGISGVLPEGRYYTSIRAPRMATGADINRLLILAGRNLFYPTHLNIRVFPLKRGVEIISFSSMRIRNLLSAIASLAMKNIRLEFVSLYTGNDENSETILNIGYRKDEIYDFRSWIARTVINEGAQLINPTSDYTSIREQLSRYIKQKNQIELFVRYRGIGRFEDILKTLSQNFRPAGYLYRYERNAFSFRMILPENTYQMTKDELMTEIKKYSKDLRLIDHQENESALIPLSVYTKIIHSCS